MNFADGYYKKSILQKLTGNNEILTVFCSATNMPLVECSEESFNDQVFVVETEDLLKSFAARQGGKKIKLRGVKFAPKDKLRYFTMLLSANIDEIVYIDKLGRHITKVSEIIRKNDMSNIPEEKRPIENPQLLLSGMYFAQEMAREVPREEKTGLKELGDEFMANLLKSKLLVPFEPADPVKQQEDAGDPAKSHEVATDPAKQQEEAGDPAKPQERQIRMPLIKTPENNIFIPVFSDMFEFQRYNKGGKLKALNVPFTELRKFLVSEAKGFMLNPAGFHLIISPGPPVSKNSSES